MAATLPTDINEELSALSKLSLTKTRLRELEKPPAADLVSLLKQKEEEVIQLQAKLESELKEKREKEEEVNKLNGIIEAEREGKREFHAKSTKVILYHSEKQNVLLEKLKLAEERVKEASNFQLKEIELKNAIIKLEQQLEESKEINNKLTEQVQSALELISKKDGEIQNLKEAVQLKEEQENKFAATLAQKEEVLKRVASKAAKTLEIEKTFLMNNYYYTVVKKDELIKKLREDNVKSVTAELANKDDLIRKLREKKANMAFDLIQQDIEIRKLKEEVKTKEVKTKKVTEELAQKNDVINEMKEEVKIKEEKTNSIAAELALKCEEVQQLKLNTDQILKREKELDVELKRERADLAMKSNEIHQLNFYMEEILEREKKKDEELKKERALNAAHQATREVYKIKLAKRRQYFQVSKCTEREHRILIKQKEDETEMLKSKLEELRNIFAERDAEKGEKEVLNEQIYYYQGFLRDMLRFLEDYGIEIAEGYVEDQINAGLRAMVDILQSVQADSAISSEIKETEIHLMKSRVEELEIVLAERDDLHSQKEEKMKEEVLRYQAFLMHILSILQEYDEGESSKMSCVDEKITAGLTVVIRKLQSAQADPALSSEIKERTVFQESSLLHAINFDAGLKEQKEEEKEMEKEEEMEMEMEEEEKEKEKKEEEMEMEKEEEEKEKEKKEEEKKEKEKKGKGKEKAECSYEISEEEEESADRRQKARRF